MSANETDPLLTAAESIADGTVESLDRLVDDSSAADIAVVRALVEIGKIAAFHRSAGSTETKPIDPAVSRASIGTWGHLTLLEMIDEGAFGSVYRAHDPNLQIDVALKLIPIPEGPN